MTTQAERRPDPRARLVLVVDSDAATRALYRRALEMAGHTVCEAANGREALVRALIDQPELVITESRLPILDGYALCEILRHDTLTRTTPILVVTADTDTQSTIRHAIAVGADSVLTKPTSIETIRDEARRLLALGRGDGADARSGNVAGATAGARRVRMAQSKLHARFDTTSPPAPPPVLRCPLCDQSLAYQRSHIGGVSERHPEQWDYYVCTGSCGGFEYRQRTRKLRRVR